MDIRFCDVAFWFPQVREKDCSRAFWTITQESFHRSYMMRNIAIADQRRLGWDELERAAGMPILPLFKRFQGFIRLFSEVD